LKGDHFVVHPDLPAIAKLFMRVPDAQIWLTNPAPAQPVTDSDSQ